MLLYALLCCPDALLSKPSILRLLGGSIRSGRASRRGVQLCKSFAWRNQRRRIPDLLLLLLTVLHRHIKLTSLWLQSQLSLQLTLISQPHPGVPSPLTPRSHHRRVSTCTFAFPPLHHHQEARCHSKEPSYNVTARIRRFISSLPVLRWFAFWVSQGRSHCLSPHRLRCKWDSELRHFLLIISHHTSIIVLVTNSCPHLFACD